MDLIIVGLSNQSLQLREEIKKVKFQIDCFKLFSASKTIVSLQDSMDEVMDIREDLEIIINKLQHIDK